jgi:aryl-alcohol dehydrogenase-like predicted oxidoreductase
MGMSWAYGDQADRDDDRSLGLIRQALDLGVNFLDTAEGYGAGHNERLVGAAIAGRRDQAVIASKVGVLVDQAGNRVQDGSPRHVREGCEASLRRLGVEHIDLYYLHRIDPAVPLADTWAAMAELGTEGKVRALGLSEVTVEEAAQAHSIHPVTAIQSEMSLWTRDPLGVAPLGQGGPGNVVGWCAAHGATFVPYAPLGRGFLTGTITTAEFAEQDWRSAQPRFQPDALTANQKLVEVIRAVAERHGATSAQVAIAWTLAQGEHVIPIPGTKKPHYLLENAAASRLNLTTEELATLDNLPDPIGGRY